MRRILPLLVAVLCLPAFAGDETKPWPQKGDTVYVAAPLAGFSPGSVVGYKAPDIPAIDACAPVTVKKAAEVLVVLDDTGNTRRITGWSGRVHATAQECRAQIASEGLPRVKTSGGYRYEIHAPSL